MQGGTSAAAAAAGRSGSSNNSGGSNSHKKRQRAAAAAAAAPSAASAVATPTMVAEEREEEEEEESHRAREQAEDTETRVESMARMMAEMAHTISSLSAQISTTERAAEARRQRRIDAAAAESDDDSHTPPLGQPPRRTAALSAAAVRKQQAAVKPEKLLYDKACSSSVVEEWFDSMELMFEQIGMEADDARLREVRANADRDIHIWWKQLQQQAEEDGAPIDTWERFKTVLRAQFLPLSEAQEAISALINIRQQAGESMEKYFQRATRLVARAGTFSDSAAMQIVMDRVRKDEWRCAMAIATRDVQAGKIKTLVVRDSTLSL